MHILVHMYKPGLSDYFEKPILGVIVQLLSKIPSHQALQYHS